MICRVSRRFILAEIRCPLETAAERWPDSPALIVGGDTVTFCQLLTLVRKSTAWLESHNSGTRLVLTGINSAEFVIWLLASLRRSLPVLVDPKLPAGSLRNLFSGLDATHFLGLPHGGNLTAAGLNEIPLPEIDLLPDPTDVPPIRYDLESPATVILTSGTTAAPKPLRHSWGNHYYSALGANENLPIKPNDRWLLSLPLYHVGGLGILFRCLLGGSTVVIPDKNSSMVNQIKRHRITHLSLVPTQLQRLIASERAHEAAESLKVVLLGGSPLANSLLTQARKRRLPVYPTYGLSEMTSQVATWSAEDPDRLSLLRYRELQIGPDNEILVRGETLFQGYLVDGKVQLPLDNEGWFHTGDIGEHDEQHGLRLTGRKDNRFISGGENIHPEQIEARLSEIDGIDDSLVVPVPDEEYGQRPVAFLQCKPGIYLSDGNSPFTEEERLRLDHQSLTDTLARSLPSFMLPLAFYPWPESWAQTGLKPDRVMFRSLAERLVKARGK